MVYLSEEHSASIFEVEPESPKRRKRFHTM
jgi:hypothetical protein